MAVSLNTSPALALDHIIVGGHVLCRTQKSAITPTASVARKSDERISNNS